MTITQVDAAPAFEDDGTDYTAKFVNLITSSPDYVSWFEDVDGIADFVQEFTACRHAEGSLHFVGNQNGEDIAYVGVSGMSLPTPEIQITVKEGYRGKGCGGEMLRSVVDWLFKNTEKEVFLYRIAADNSISERLVISIGGVLREPKYEIERATVKTYEIRREGWA